MSYLDELEKMSVLNFFKQASHRIDGIAMYLVCAFFALFSFYSAIADWLGSPLPDVYSKRFWDALLLVPIIFILYISLVWYSTPGLRSRLINAVLLLNIPLYVAYKFNFF